MQRKLAASHLQPLSSVTVVAHSGGTLGQITYMETKDWLGHCATVIGGCRPTKHLILAQPATILVVGKVGKALAGPAATLLLLLLPQLHNIYVCMQTAVNCWRWEIVTVTKDKATCPPNTMNAKRELRMRMANVADGREIELAKCLQLVAIAGRENWWGGQWKWQLTREKHLRRSLAWIMHYSS